MKKSLIVLFSAFLFACGDAGDKAESKEEKKDATTTPSTATTQFPPGITQDDYDKGLRLIAGSDCLGCHQINQKTTGPAYADIAKKYEPTEANIELLAEKVIKGGTGNWGQVPMLPHDSLSKDDARTMVKYVLSLRNMQ